MVTYESKAEFGSWHMRNKLYAERTERKNRVRQAARQRHPARKRHSARKRHTDSF